MGKTTVIDTANGGKISVTRFNETSDEWGKTIGFDADGTNGRWCVNNITVEQAKELVSVLVEEIEFHTGYPF